jgi:TatD DNase family protein
MPTKIVEGKAVKDVKQLYEMADAHCHLDAIKDQSLIQDAIAHGIMTMVSNGVSFPTNKRTLEISDGKHIFPALGMDPQNAVQTPDDDLDSEIENNIKLIRDNRSRVVSIGEIGLDYLHAKDFNLVAKQRTVFERFIDLATELKLPVSVHSRDSLDDVMETLKAKDAQKVHLHFFEGNVQQAKEAERLGYMISIPPITSSKRSRIMKEVSIDNLMVESDSPAVGPTPKSVELSVHMIAEAKMISVERAAEVLTMNTKRFFKINVRKPQSGAGIGFIRT